MKKAAEKMMEEQVEQAALSLAANQQILMSKLASKQALEADVLAARGVRGRDELELRRATEVERRVFRFRNVVMVRERVLRIHPFRHHMDTIIAGTGESPPARSGIARELPRWSGPRGQGRPSQGRLSA